MLRLHSGKNLLRVLLKILMFSSPFLEMRAAPDTRSNAAPRPDPKPAATIRTGLAPVESSPPDRLPAELLQQIQAQLQTKQWAAATQTYQALLQSTSPSTPLPALIPFYLPIARSYFLLGSPQHALDALLKALQPAARTLGSTRSMSPGDLQLFHAACLAQLSRFQEARTLLAPLLAPNTASSQTPPPTPLPTPPHAPPIGPGQGFPSPEAWLLYASCLAAEGRPQEAAQSLAPRFAGFPPPYRAQALLGCLQFLFQALQKKTDTAIISSALDLIHPQLFSSKESAPFSESSPTARASISRIWQDHPVSRQIFGLQFAGYFMEKGGPENARTALAFLLFLSPLPNSVPAVAQPSTSAQTNPLFPHPAPPDSALSHRATGTVPDASTGRADSKEGNTETELLKKYPDLWSRIRLQVAGAYQALNRHHEAALVLQQSAAHLSESDPLKETVFLHSLHAWNQAARPDKVRDTAAQFLKEHPRSVHLPEALYWKASAHREEKSFAEAIRDFQMLAVQFPKSAHASAARFQSAYCQFLAGNASTASTEFSRLTAALGTHPLAEESAAWEVLTQLQDPQTCRAAADRYLKRHPNGTHVGAVRFHKAKAAHHLDDLNAAIQELESFLKEFPDHTHQEEALLLLAEAQMASGHVEAGTQLLAQIPLSDSALAQEAWFRRGKTLRLEGQFSGLLAHMAHFAQTQPKSPRLSEAVLQTAWCQRKLGNEHAADALSWETVRLYGNDPDNTGVDEILLTLCRPRPDPESIASVSRQLETLREESTQSGKQTLALRCVWANARLRSKSAPEEASQLLIAAANRVQPENAPPAVLADLADALPTTSNPSKLWTELLRWNPNAPQKDRALLALARATLSVPWESQKFLDRLETETPTTPLLPQALLLRAQLLRSEKPEAALVTLAKILTLPSAGSRQKAEALFASGAIHHSLGHPEQAIPFYQRVYVTYLRWPDLTAQAYLKSASAFESLGDRTAARRTCQEFLLQPTISNADRIQANRLLETLQ